MSKVEEGVLFPANSAGRRSTIAGGTAVFAAAAKAVDPALASKDGHARACRTPDRRATPPRAAPASITSEKKWRQAYGKWVTELEDASVKSPDAAIKAARAGLECMYETFEFVRDGKTSKLADAMAAPAPERKLFSGTVRGGGAKLTALEVPYEGGTLSGEALTTQLAAWTAYGCLEPAAEAAIAGAATNAGWLDLSGRCFVVLGATSALGPLHTLLECGATVIAVARKKPANWAELIAAARASAGTLVLPLGADLAADATNEEVRCARCGRESALMLTWWHVTCACDMCT
eukprot:2596192-Prymnesium_polylepis.1